MTPLEERNRKKHINAVAKDILCAMVSANKPVVYHQGYRPIVDADFIRQSFMIAEAFVEHELK